MQCVLCVQCVQCLCVQCVQCLCVLCVLCVQCLCVQCLCACVLCVQCLCVLCVLCAVCCVLCVLCVLCVQCLCTVWCVYTRTLSPPQDNTQYRVHSEVRGQLRVLETIDRLIDKRKTERDNEQTLKAAKSRSKGADPIKAAEIREVARQVRLSPL